MSMERWADFLRGQLRVRVEGIQTEKLLNLCAGHGVEFWDIYREDGFQLLLTIRKRDQQRFLALAQRCGCLIRDIREKGASKRLAFLRGRRIFALCTLLVLGALFWSSLYVWRIEVKGNETVPTGLVLNALEDSGVGLGSFWPKFTSDNIRSRVLAQLPELRWITVNINGSCAEVIVRERTAVPEIYDEKEFTDIVASVGGVVEEVTALNGVPLVKEGDTVAAGDVLISGEAENMMDRTRLLHALGSVQARTWHSLTAVCPAQWNEKGAQEAGTWRFSLGFSKDLLKFYPNSGILPAGCGRIIREYSFGIPGFYTLPVSLRVERLSIGPTKSVSVDEEAAARRLKCVLLEELQHRIGADGEITSQSFSVEKRGGLIFVKLEAECLQEIGMEAEATP